MQFNEEVHKNIRLIPRIGEEQFQMYWTECLILAKVPIDKVIKESTFLSPGSSDLQRKTKKDPVLTQSTISKLCCAYKYRKKYTTELFINEIFGIAQSISKDSTTLYHGQKS